MGGGGGLQENCSGVPYHVGEVVDLFRAEAAPGRYARVPGPVQGRGCCGYMELRYFWLGQPIVSIRRNLAMLVYGLLNRNPGRVAFEIWSEDKLVLITAHGTALERRS